MFSAWFKRFTTRSVPINSNQIFDVLGRYAPTSSGVQVNKDSVFGLPAFYRGVDLISSTVGRTPCPVYRRGPNNSREKYKEHPAYDLLNRQANPLLTAFVFRKQLTANAIWAGNGYAWVEKDSLEQPTGLYLLDSDTTYPVIVYSGLQPEVYYVTTIGNQQIKLDASAVIHLKGLGNSSGLVGMRLIDVCKEALGLGIAVQKYGGTYFKNNGAITTVIELPLALKDEDAVRKFRAGFEDAHAGIDNVAKVALLQAGAKLNRIPLNNQEAEWVNSRGLTLVDCANILGLPAHKLNSAVNTSYASIEAENLSLLSDTYDPIFVNLEQELENKLLREAEKVSDTVFIEFMRDALARGDAASESTRLLNELNQGGISFEEYRRIRNLPDKDPNETWRIPVQVQIEGQPQQPQADPQQAPPDKQDKQPAEQPQAKPNAARAIIRATIERLLTRVRKDSSGYLAKHREVFGQALPGLDGFIDRLFVQLEDEWESVLPEQRGAVLDRLDIDSLTEEAWNDVLAA